MPARIAPRLPLASELLELRGFVLGLRSGDRKADELSALRGLCNGVLIGTSIMQGAGLGRLVAGGRG